MSDWRYRISHNLGTLTAIALFVLIRFILKGLVAVISKLSSRPAPA